MAAPLPSEPLTDGTIRLRPPHEGDLDALIIACQDPEIPRWTLVPSPYTADHARAWVPDAAAEARAGTGLHLLAVSADAQERLLGAVGLMEVDRERGTGEVGYWIAAPARRRGVASRAVILVRDLAARLGLHSLELLPHRDNVPSQRVAERAGFVRTDELRPAPRTAAPGEPDHLVYVWRAASSSE